MNLKLIVLGTISSLVFLAPAHAAIISSFATAEATYTDSGLKYKGSTFAPNGYELGAGVTGGVLFDQKHEISLSTGYTKWTGPHNVVVGVADGHSTAEQVPLLLNYRYHLRRPTEPGLNGAAVRRWRCRWGLSLRCLWPLG